MTGPRPGRRLSHSVRATSTTLDVVLCLVLLSAAVGVLTAAGPPENDHDPRSASRAATLLGSTTVTVEYAPRVDSSASTDGRDVVESPVQTRVVHGTPAALLARAAVVDASVGVSRSRTAVLAASRFADAVSSRTRRVLVAVAAHVNVSATYAPVAGSDRRGRVTVGPNVPPGMSVSVARVTVPVAAASVTGEPRPVTVVVRTWST